MGKPLLGHLQENHGGDRAGAGFQSCTQRRREERRARKDASRCGWAPAVAARRSGAACRGESPARRLRPQAPSASSWGPPGTPPWPPGAPAAPHRARAPAAARSRPRGGAGREASQRAAPRTRRGSPVPGPRNPARPAPGPGPQISSPGGRGHSAGRPSPRPPRPLAAAAGTRPGPAGRPVWAPLRPLRAPAGSLLGLRGPSRALPPGSPRVPGLWAPLGRRRGRPGLEPKCPLSSLVWGVGGASPFSQVCPSRHIRAFQPAARKCRMHALIYLFCNSCKTQ